MALPIGLTSDIDLSGTIIVSATADGEYAVDADLREPQLATPAPGSSDPDTHGPERDCVDYFTRKEAQASYGAAGGPTSDPHRLDSDDRAAYESNR